MNDQNTERRCDGETFLGFTVRKCDQRATVHAYQDEQEQYDFCPRHYFFWLHGRYPEQDAPTSGSEQNTE
jgi:hypothetical protein